MSVIIREWYCDNCKSKINQYVSFGHPDKGFDYKWKCGICGNINVAHIYGYFDPIHLKHPNDEKVKYNLNRWMNK